MPKHLGEREYTIVKTLLNNGLNMNQVTKTTGWSYPVVIKVRESEDFKGYKEITAKIKQERDGTLEYAPVPEAQPAVYEDYNAKNLTLMKRQTNALEQIAESLKWLSDNMEVPHKRKFLR
jgi:hypothetical protein